MLRHQLGEQFFRALDLHIDDSIVIVDFARPHFSPMDNDNKEETVDDDQRAICNVRLHIYRVPLDMIVILEQ